MKNKVCHKTRSPPASFLFKGQGIDHTTVKWPVVSFSKRINATCKNNNIITQANQHIEIYGLIQRE